MGRLLNYFLIVLAIIFLISLYLVGYKSVQYLDQNSRPLNSIGEEVPETGKDEDRYGDNEPDQEFDIDAILEDPAASLDGTDEYDDLDIESILAELEEEEPAAGIVEKPVSPQSLSEASNTGSSSPAKASRGAVSASATLPAGIPSDYDKKGNFYVIAGSFRQKLNAENESKRLQRLGFPEARIVDFGSKAYAIVAVGNYPNRREAEAVVRLLKEKHQILAYIRQK